MFGEVKAFDFIFFAGTETNGYFDRVEHREAQRERPEESRQDAHRLNAQLRNAAAGE